MFNENSMISFQAPTEFSKFYEELSINGWKITDEYVNDRGQAIRHSSYAETFRKLFDEKHLFRRKLSIGELVSFVDNYYLINKLLLILKDTLSKEKYDKIKLFSEYRIIMSKNRRIDFILEYEEKVLLLEFRISNKFPNVSSTWQRKEAELLIYKELVNNYLPKRKDIFIYAFIGMPEYSLNVPIKKHIIYNNNNLEHLAKYINMFIVSERSS